MLKRFFSQSLFYLLISYGIQAINIVFNWICIQYLTTSALGNLTIAKLWMQVFDYSHLGTRFSMDRLIPVDKSNKTTLLSISIYITSIVSLFILAICWFLNKTNIYIITYAIAGLVIALSNVFKAYYRANEELDKMFLIVLCLNLIPLSIITPLLYIFKNDKVIYLYGLIHIVILLLFIIRGNIFHIKQISLQEFKKNYSSIFSLSSVLLINSLVVFTLMSIDRIFIDHKLGKEVLGEYSVILFVFSALMMIPSVLVELIYPRIVKNTVTTRRLLYVRETLFVFIPTAIAVVITNYVINFFIIRFTNYGYLSEYIHIILYGVIPYAFTGILFHVINSLDKKWLILLVNSITLFIVLGIYLLLDFLDLVSFQNLIYVKIFSGFLPLALFSITLIILNKQIIE